MNLFDIELLSFSTKRSRFMWFLNWKESRPESDDVYIYEEKENKQRIVKFQIWFKIDLKRARANFEAWLLINRIVEIPTNSDSFIVDADS